MLYIRADGNTEIGTGHIMRCLSIAQAAKRLGKPCTFITADESMKPLLDEQGFRVICLHSVWNDLDQETAQMEALIRRENIQSLLVDSYFVTPDYLARLHRLTHVTYIDDLNGFVYPCSTLVNYNLYASQCDYGSRYPETRLLLGPRYAPLRAEFQGLSQRNIREGVRDVLVTSGGGDPLNVAGRLVQCAKQSPETAALTYHIVVGRFNQHLPMLEQLARNDGNVRIHRNVRRMSELMLACDVAISAGGSTLYELCACGIPTIMYTLADNQLQAASVFEKEQIMLCAGDARSSPDFINSLVSRLSDLVQNSAQRKEMASRMQRVVDGNGANRIANILLNQRLY